MAYEKALQYTGAFATLYSLYRLLTAAYVFIRPSSLPRYLRSHNGQKSWALITGASDGIGAALAHELCARGFNVAIHGRNPEKLMRVQNSLAKEYPNALTRVVVADASSFTASTIDEIVSSLSDIHITVLINNVGGTASLDRDFKTLEDHTAKEVEGLININLVFTTQITRVLLPTLKRNEPSLILNTGSQAEMGFPWLTVYSGTKSYLTTWTKALSRELRASKHDIEVLCIGVASVQSGQNLAEESFFVPSSRAMAKASLERVGCGQTSVTGYLPHALQRAPLDLLPTWLFDITLVSVLEPMYENASKKFRSKKVL